MKISVIIPVYNGEKTIEGCLNSVLKQSFEEYEIVIIDDGSIDQTAEKCKKYQKTNSKIQYYYQENAGVSAARNYGIEKSYGEFITFIDADDIIDEHYLEILYTKCIEENADIVVCDVVVEVYGAEKYRFSCNTSVMNHIVAIEKLLSRQEINSGPCAKLFRRKTVGNVSFPELKTYEDIIFVLYVFDNAKKIISTSQTEYHYISNPDSAMNTLDILNSFDILVASSEIIKYLHNNRSVFTDMPFYTTVSHVMQYIQQVYNVTKEVNESPFLRQSFEFMKANRTEIKKNTKFTFKEKCLYLLLSYNLYYSKKYGIRKLSYKQKQE